MGIGRQINVSALQTASPAMNSESPSTADCPDTDLMIVYESSISRTILGPDPDAFQRWERQRNTDSSSSSNDTTLEGDNTRIQQNAQMQNGDL